jgi:hypothetical protein
VECFHIAGFVVSIGMVTIVDLRLLGLVFRRQSAAELNAESGLWSLGGLIVAIFTGFMLFSTDPDMYYTNQTFLIKMACLALAIGFDFTIHRKVISSPVSAGTGKLVACVSLALWVSIVFGGIFISVNPFS